MKKISFALAALVLLAGFLDMNYAHASRTPYAPNDLTISAKNDPNDFVIKAKTDNPGISANDQFTIPTFPGEVYDYSVDCDSDGIHEATHQIGDYTCDYAGPGTYNISISGTFPRIYFAYTAEGGKLLSVEQWGKSPWTSMARAFSGAYNMTLNATDSPNLSHVTDMSAMFAETSLNQDISGWDVGKVTDMSALFAATPFFNQDISSWDVSKVASMSDMFAGNNAFNQKISNWDVSGVKNMFGMFSSTLFNEDIGSWDVGNVTDMSYMLAHNTAFNQKIGSWDVGNVKEMRGMFAQNTAFNQAIGNWDVSGVTDMSGIFSGAAAFNQDIGGWNVGNVTNMTDMFSYTPFNHNLGNWDVSNVTNMTGMFADTPFNQDIGGWDVSKVTDMHFMFADAIDFDQNIGNWNIASVTDMTDMFTGARLSTPNYDSLLAGWNAQAVQPKVPFHGGDSTYCKSEPDRSSLITAHLWSIDDGGMMCP